jgi:MarR family transcriptional regulator, negative regulator of the multidrug operon emrRAB
MHCYFMEDDRLENLLGALVVALSDSMSAAVESAAGRPGAAGAALAVLAQEPGLGIEQLRLPLRRTQSATVRVVDQLVAEGRARRQAGHDRRSVAVVLTDQGTATAASVLDSRHSVLRDAVAGLGPGERTALTGTLEKVLASVTADAVHAEQICRLCDVRECPPRNCPVNAAGGERPPGSRPALRPIPERFRNNEHRTAASNPGS